MGVPMSATTQAVLLRQHLRDLQQLMQESQQFYRSLEQKVLANKASLNTKMKVVDGIAFLGQALLGVAKLAGATAGAMKLTGRKLAESNAKALRELGSQSVSKSRGVTGLIYDTNNPALDLALNFDSPNYWAKKVTGVNPDLLFAGLLQKIREASKEGLARIDGYIVETQSRVRYCEGGGDLSKLA